MSITYNVLNLQQSLNQNGMTVASYTWLSDGTKCAVVDNTTNGYDYLGSLIYSRSGSVRTLESAAFGGGRFVNTNNTILPYYYITDHLGSTRVITDNSGNVVERNDYYPFGGKHANGTYPQLTVNKQKFNGKELQTTGNTGFLDYGARMYDDVIGRWGVVDPWAEKYHRISSYVYCANNPIRFVDIRGAAIGDPLKMMRVRNDSRSNTFGMVRQRIDGTPRAHQGMDYEAPIGTPIYTVKDGVVVDVIPESKGGDYGVQIIIEFEDEDGNKAYAAYAHLSEVSVKKGDRVYEKSEKAIGKTGDSGNAKGMNKKNQHLHFEYRTKQKVSKGLEGRDNPNKIVDTKFIEDPKNKDKVIKEVNNDEQKNDEKTANNK